MLTRLALFTAALAATTSLAYADSDVYSVGAEGFTDHYKETSLDVNDHTVYGAVTGSYTHNFNAFFGKVEGRASDGRDDYKSPSGTIEGIPEYEFEGRLLGGPTAQLGNGMLDMYTGLGTRYFDQQGKGLFSNTFSIDYDRRILQEYLPVGLTYHYAYNEWTFTPNVEYDHLLWGRVSSRLQNIGVPGANVTNDQSAGSGHGFRGEFMVGQQKNGYAWQAGPFVRYWDIDKSKISYLEGYQVWEPANTRLQTGIGVKFLF